MLASYLFGRVKFVLLAAVVQELRTQREDARRLRLDGGGGGGVKLPYVMLCLRLRTHLCLGNDSIYL